MINTLPLSQIKVEGRLREDLGDIEELAESIRDNGLLQPIVVEYLKSSNTYELRAGGRRYAAFTLLSLNKVSSPNPDSYKDIPIVRLDEMPPYKRIKIEMEENLRRKQMTWLERVIGIVKFHNACRRAAVLDGEKWSQAATGAEIGMDQASVSLAITVYEQIKAGNEKVLAAESLTDAIKIISGANLDAAQAERLRRIQLKRAEQTLPNNSNGQPAQAAQLPQISSTILHEAKAQSPSIVDTKVQCSIEEVAAFYHHGDALKVLPLLAKTTRLDHIICDPPYAIDLANLTREDIGRFESLERVKETHQIEPNLQLLEAFLEVSFNCIAEDGFLCMWYDLDHHEKIKTWAEKIGWKVQRWPFHWCKTSPCLNNAAQYNITKAIEHCYFFRRSEKSIIKKKQSTNYLLASGDTSSSHPFTKPKEVWNYLIDTISTEGQTIIDPFAGEGSSLAAIFQAKRVPIGIEIDEKHIAAGLSFIQERINKKNILDDLLKDSLL